MFNLYFESVPEYLDCYNWVPESHNQAKVSVNSIIQRLLDHASIIKIRQSIKISKKTFLSHQ